MGESREDVETGYDEEASSESEIPTVETNLQNPMSRAEQEREYVDMLLTGIFCAVCVKGRCIRKHLQRDELEEEGSSESYVLRAERFHLIFHFISCRLENPFENREWTEYEKNESTHCERNEKTTQKLQDFG